MEVSSIYGKNLPHPNPSPLQERDFLWLIVELDGEVHKSQAGYDANRDSILVELGFDVLRFRNQDMVDIDLVLEQIRSQIGQ